MMSPHGLLKPMGLETMLRNKGCHFIEKAHAPQLECSLYSLQLEKSSHSNKDPAQPKNINK